VSDDAQNAIQLDRIRAAGAKIARIYVYWRNVAPAQPALPRDPADAAYNWANIDKMVTDISAHGLQAMVTFLGAPAWAEGSGRGTYLQGTYKPSPTALADFAYATALRYGGSYSGLPRVRYWEVWNEPNLNQYLSPQTVNGRKPFAANWYRTMLNAEADQLHAVHSDNVVIAGETAPFGGSPGAGERSRTMPLFFMEQVLCLSDTAKHPSVCKSTTKFDVWAHHPYTEGGPTKKAYIHGDVSLGDMGNVRTVLNAAISAKHVVSSQAVRLWVTEFSWDTSPPDPKGVAAAVEARWVSQAIYELVQDGVSGFTWFTLRDQSFPSSYYQSGLYYLGAKDHDPGISLDVAKPALRSFRFPFVAFPGAAKNTVSFWGRLPSSAAGKVLIESNKSNATTGWKLVQKPTANGAGVFKGGFTKPAKATYFRARLANGSDTSTAFALTLPSGAAWHWTGCAFGTCTTQGG